MDSAKPLRPVILSLAPNGARRQRKDHARLPLTIEEIVSEVPSWIEAGATLLHLHIRDEKGEHTLSIDGYRELLRQLQPTVEERALIQLSTESVGRYSPEEQMAMVEAVQPQAVSIALRELLPEKKRDPSVRTFFRQLTTRSISTQYIVYSPAELEWFDQLTQSHAIPQTKPSILIVLGRFSPDQSADPSDLQPYLRLLNRLETTLAPVWSVCAFGPNEEACLIEAIRHGGHARVGFENNIWKPDGSLATDNTGQLRSLVERIDRLGFRPASIDETRALLQLA